MKTITVNIARRLASQMWGEVQRQKKIMDGVWWFSCAGHGGYVVDLESHPEFAMHYAFVETRYGSGQGYSDEQHFAILEEDCNAVMMDYLYYDYLEISQKRLTNCSKKDMRQSLQQWNLIWLQALEKASSYADLNLAGLDTIIESAELHGPYAYTTATGILALYYYWQMLGETPNPQSRTALRNAGFILGGNNRGAGILPTIPQLENGYQFTERRISYVGKNVEDARGITILPDIEPVL